MCAALRLHLNWSYHHHHSTLFSDHRNNGCMHVMSCHVNVDIFYTRNKFTIKLVRMSNSTKKLLIIANILEQELEVRNYS